jgi:S-ribosylhomocysteine lyase
MEKIQSFKTDHTKMLPGIYVARKYVTPNGDTITTIDIRMKKPNYSMINPEAAHTLEHLGATFLRNEESLGERVVYFGPMGCLTGFSLILSGDWESHQLVHTLQRLMTYVIGYEGEVLGATKKECGNYSYHSLSLAKVDAREYLELLNNITEANLSYPKD